MLVFKHYNPSNRKARAKLADKFKSQVSTETTEMGISTILSAIGDFRDYLIVAFTDKIVGAVSYFKKKKLKHVEVDHIGVIDKRAGYGTALMGEVFKFAIRKRCDVSLVSNGYANEFYEGLGMRCINNGKMPSVYQMELTDIMVHYKK
jgi:hypothetical protein